MSLTCLREDAAAIFQAGLEAVNPVKAVPRFVRRENKSLIVADKCYDLDKFDGIYLIGAGKAAAAMAQPLEDLLPGFIKGGVINVKYGHGRPLRLVSINEAGHPLPDEAGLRGTEQMIRLLRQTGEKDLVIFLVSGGGSALLVSPAERLTLEDKRQTTRVLLECGAAIDEINAIRKHISRVKGGQLARLAYPSPLISLILSDVIGDRLENIASGPAVADSTTYQDCLSILEKYALTQKIPVAVLNHLKKGLRGEIEETPKPGNSIFERTQNIIIGRNIQALEAARNKAVALGYNCLILSSSIEGETREIAKMHAAVARDILIHGHPILPPACLISGGETTVSIRGGGLGGRNQEFVLAAAIAIDGLQSVVVLSGGTDGTDGPTEAAGAIADGTTLKRARALGLEAEHYLRENDSYHFFKPLGDLLITGPTYTNVMDLRVVLLGVPS